MYYYIKVNYSIREFFAFKSYAVRKQEMLVTLDSINPQLRSKIQDYEITSLGWWAKFYRVEVEQRSIKQIIDAMKQIPLSCENTMCPGHTIVPKTDK